MDCVHACGADKINQHNNHTLHATLALNQVRRVHVGVAEHRQATHEHVSTCRHPCVRANGNLRSERWRRQVPWHFMAHKELLVSGVAEVCMWLGPSHRQAKHNEKNSGVDGSLTACEDTKET